MAEPIVTSDPLSIKSRSEFIDYLAPDGSEIRLLKDGGAGGVCECTLSPGAITKPVRHVVVEELWVVVSGRGQIWRKREGEGGPGHVHSLKAGVSLWIPQGVAFQFQTVGEAPLVMLLTTMPKWNKEIEASGPKDEDGMWVPALPSPEWRVQGKWWQRSGERGSEILGLMEVVRTSQGACLIRGWAWTKGAVKRSQYTSQWARFDKDTFRLDYSWHGKLVDGTPKQGVGAVEFLVSDGAITRGGGYYVAEAGTETPTIVPTQYARVKDEELRTVDDLSAELWNTVVENRFQ